MIIYLLGADLSNSANGNTDDGVPPSLEWLADVKVADSYAEILMRRVSLGWYSSMVVAADTWNGCRLYENMVSLPGAGLGDFFTVNVFWVLVFGCGSSVGSDGTEPTGFLVPDEEYRQLVQLKDAHQAALTKLLFGPAFISLAFLFQNNGIRF